MAKLGTLALLFLLASGPVLEAHHGTFYKSIFSAIEKKDLESVKGWFSDSAWKGSDESVRASLIQERLENSEELKYLREFASHRALGPNRRARCVVLFRIKDSGKKERSWIFLLAEHPGNRNSLGGVEQDSWRIMKIVEDLEQAESYLGREFFPRDLLRKP